MKRRNLFLACLLLFVLPLSAAKGRYADGEESLYE